MYSNRRARGDDVKDAADPLTPPGVILQALSGSTPDAGRVRRGPCYDEARAWAQEIAERVVEALPDRATTQRSKVRRGRRVYVDVMQSAKGRHAVPPYVLRAVPRATLSTPLNWNELTSSLDPAQFTLKTIFRRLARQKRDPLVDLMGPVARMRRA
jgi:DNA primase